MKTLVFAAMLFASVAHADDSKVYVIDKNDYGMPCTQVPLESTEEYAKALETGARQRGWFDYKCSVTASEKTVVKILSCYRGKERTLYQAQVQGHATCMKFADMKAKMGK